MRHNQDTRNVQKESTDKKVRRQRHRRRTTRKKDRKPPATPTYFSVWVTIMAKPKMECTIFRGNELREEVVTEGIVHAESWKSRYTVRFTNKNLIEEAKKLCGGTKIFVTKGRFEERPKRAGLELRIAEYRKK